MLPRNAASSSVVSRNWVKNQHFFLFDGDHLGEFFQSGELAAVGRFPGAVAQ
jgi:hypothetical protein